MLRGILTREATSTTEILGPEVSKVVEKLASMTSTLTIGTPRVAVEEDGADREEGGARARMTATMIVVKSITTNAAEGEADADQRVQQYAMMAVKTIMIRCTAGIATTEATKAIETTAVEGPEVRMMTHQAREPIVLRMKANIPKGGPRDLVDVVLTNAIFRHKS